MQILYIIGNGFDLNLGFKTSYQDFYQYYQKQKSNYPLIKDLKNNIDENFESWANLELALGQYTQNLNSVDELDIIFDDLTDNLANYLDNLDAFFEKNDFDDNKFLDDIRKPEKYLREADKIELSKFINDFQNRNVIIKAITFNYTKFFDYFFGEKTYQHIEKYKINEASKVYFSHIHHIHGYTDNRMIMGVDNLSQISNTSFHKNIDAIETLVKVEYNKSSKETIDEKCKSMIESTDLFCIFGSSIGDTDKTWWNLIGQELLYRNRRLIIFHYAQNSSNRQARYISRVERFVKKNFLDKLDITNDEKEIVSQKIFVSIGSNMFNIHQKPTTQHIAPPSIT